METEKGDRNENGAGSLMEGFFVRIDRPTVMKGIEKSIISALSVVIVISATTKSILLSIKPWNKSS